MMKRPMLTREMMRDWWQRSAAMPSCLLVPHLKGVYLFDSYHKHPTKVFTFTIT